VIPLWTLVAFFLLGAAANAACTNGVTSLTLSAGGTAVHVTAVDQNCNPLPTATITWTGTGEPVTIASDATGFNISAPSSDTAGGATATATYNAVPVTGLGFLLE
jgi:hypothetical protein